MNQWNNFIQKTVSFFLWDRQIYTRIRLSFHKVGMIQENTFCQVFGKPVIVMQIFGCCQSVVCCDHAEKIPISMMPGEKKKWSLFYFLRFLTGGE
jgi:hypothetical protein